MTLPILQRILVSMQTLPIPHADRLTLSAAFALAYIGGMRCGELTYDTGSFNAALHLSKSCFTDFGDYGVIRLPYCKTDSYRKDVNVVIPSAPPACAG